MFIGVGESALTPTAMSLLADRFPAQRLGFAAGIYYMGIPLGVGLSLLVAGYLGPAIGWRNCFYLLGGLGITLAVFTLFIRETRPGRRAVLTGPEQRSVSPRSFLNIMTTLVRALRTCPALSLTIAGGVSFHFIVGAAVFDQLWFVQERGFERAQIAQLTGWIGMVAGVLGNLFGGIGSDLWLRRTGQGQPTFLFWVTLILAPILITYRLVSPETPWFSLGIFCSFFLLGSFYGPTFSTVQELVPPQIRGTIIGFYILMLNIVGLGFGITAGGLLVDLLIARDAGQPYTTMLLGFTFLSLLAIPLFYAAGKRFTTDRARLFALETEEGEEGTG